MDMRKLLVAAIAAALIIPVVMSVLAQEQVPTLRYVEYQFSQSIEDYYVIYVNVPSGADTNTLYVVAIVNGSEFAVPYTVIGNRLFFRGGNTSVYRVYWGQPIPDYIRWLNDRKLVFHWIEDFDNPYYIDVKLGNVGSYTFYPAQGYIRFDVPEFRQGVLAERHNLRVPFDCFNMIAFVMIKMINSGTVSIRIIDDVAGSVVASNTFSAAAIGIVYNYLLMADAGFVPSGIYGVVFYKEYNSYSVPIEVDYIGFACGKVPSYTTVSGIVQPPAYLRIYPYAAAVVTVYQPTTVYVPTTVTVPAGVPTTFWTTIFNNQTITAIKYLTTTLLVPTTITYNVTIPVITTVTKPVTTTVTKTVTTTVNGTATSIITIMPTTYTTTYETTTSQPVVTTIVTTTVVPITTPYTTVTVTYPWYITQIKYTTIWRTITTTITTTINGQATTVQMVTPVAEVYDVGEGFNAIALPIYQYVQYQPVPVVQTATVTETVTVGGILPVTPESALLLAIVLVLGLAIGYLIKRGR